MKSKHLNPHMVQNNFSGKESFMFLSDEREQTSLTKDILTTQEISAEFNKEELFNALVAVSAAQIDSDIGWVQIYFTGEQKIVFSSVSHNLAIKYECFVPHSGSGLIKVSGKQFSEYIKQLPQATIHLKAELPHRVNLKCAGSSAKIQLVQDQSQSQVMPSKAGSSISAKGAVLERWISTFKDLVLVDDSRFYANGALIWAEAASDSNKLYAVASDALRLSQAVLNEGIEILNVDQSQVIVPRKTLDELKRECSLKPEKNFILKWSKDELSFSAETECYLLSSKCIAGHYPPYEAALPQKINLEISLDSKKLQDCVRRSLIFADKNKVMKLMFENSVLKMASFTPGQKEGEEVIDIESKFNSPFEVNYNGHHLAGILNLISGSKVGFYWESVNKPVKIVGEDQRGVSVFYLLVPSRF
jgi:DNA polymerase III sliding clamp (beta) subunit (PCNA family)